MMTPGGAQGLFPLLQHGVGTAVMDVIGCEHGDSAMAVLGVVPREERPAEGDGGVDIVESLGEAVARERSVGRPSSQAMDLYMSSTLPVVGYVVPPLIAWRPHPPV